MIAMLLVLIICSANFVIGFALAMHMGHGPPSLPSFDKLTKRLQSLAKRKAKSHESPH
jgi:hypothetical protein